MFKKFISVFCMFFGILTAAHAGPAANVEYIHNAVREKWGVELTTAANPRTIANMEYLLAAVDVVNEQLNGYKSSDYVNNKSYATRQVVDIDAVNTAISDLVSEEWSFLYEFEYTQGRVMPGMTITAHGTFYVDWGDGTGIHVISGPGNYAPEAPYSTSGTYTVRMSGRATAYQDGASAITFCKGSTYYRKIMNNIRGSISKMFPTLPDGTNPNFSGIFQDCALTKSLTLSDTLFAGLYGQASDYMFANAFAFYPQNCSVSIGAVFKNVDLIPSPYMFNGAFMGQGQFYILNEDLFAGIRGIPTEGLFKETFAPGVQGTVFKKLFAGISGMPAAYMFEGTFQSSSIRVIEDGAFSTIYGPPAEGMFKNTFKQSSILTTVPENLFAGISGLPAKDMFYGTFYMCYNLQTNPENLFGNISGTAMDGMFVQTFLDNYSLIGSSAKIGGKYLYEIWPDATREQVGYCYGSGRYGGPTKLTDYANIPSTWK